MTDIITSTTSSRDFLHKAHRRVKLLQHKGPMQTVDTVPLLFKNHSTVPALKPSLKKNVQYNKPTVTKSVRFDIQLERIQHFYAPPPIDDDEDCVVFDMEEDDGDDDDDEENKLEDEFLELFWNSNKFQSTYAPTESKHAKHGTIALPNWPSSIHPTRRFLSQMVSLESIVWDSTKCVAKGSVLVHNISFEKKVTIRYTLDHWHTWHDVEAVYKEAAFNNSSINNSALDRFEFHIPSGFATCSLAVRYETNGQEFWDNNNSRNFLVQYNATEQQQNRKRRSGDGIYLLPSRLHELYACYCKKPTFQQHDVLSIKPSYLSI